MPIAQIRGLDLHYTLTGREDAPVLVLAHSLGVSLKMWDAQAEELGRHFRLLRYDIRGHGQSGIPPQPASVDDLGRDVLDLLHQLGIARVHFCGLSLGGSIGQWLGVHAGDRLHALVLASTAARIGTQATWNARIAQVESQGLASVIPGTLERWFTPDFRTGQPEVVTDVRRQLEATTQAGYLACCAAVRDADFRATIGQVSAPTLVIAGSHDPVTPPADGQWLAQAIPGAIYRELPAAHLASVEAAAEFREALLSFLTQR